MDEEVELKFLVRSIQAMRERLAAIGATQATPRTLERNLLFDDAERSLRKRDGILRLRKTGKKTLLTVKLPPDIPSTEAKIRKEYQVEVSDFEEMKAILEVLGFEPWGGYEKYREEFRVGNAVVSLDDMPFGEFVEIEGELQEIKSVAKSLGLNTEKRILQGYLGLMAALRDALGIELSYLTFERWNETIDWNKLGIEPADGRA